MVISETYFNDGFAELSSFADNNSYILTIYDFTDDSKIKQIELSRCELETIVNPQLWQEWEEDNKMRLHNVSTDYIMRHGNKIKSLSNSDTTVIECKNYNQFALYSKSVVIIGDILKFNHKLGQLEIYREYLGECVLVGLMPLSCITAIDVKTTVTRL